MEGSTVIGKVGGLGAPRKKDESRETNKSREKKVGVRIMTCLWSSWWSKCGGLRRCVCRLESWPLLTTENKQM